MINLVTMATEDVFEWGDTERDQPREVTTNGKDEEMRRNLPLSGFTVGVGLPTHNQIFRWTHLHSTTTQMRTISPRSGPNQHPATTITVSGRVITAALFCSRKCWMSDEVIRMLSSDWLMRGSSQRRGRSLCPFPGTLNSFGLSRF